MSCAWAQSGKGKHYELEVCRRLRAATGWSKEEVHRHDAETRTGEQGVGDVVTPAPVLIQVRARGQDPTWKALQDAEEAARDHPELLPVGVSIWTRGQGVKAVRLAALRRRQLMDLLQGGHLPKGSQWLLHVEKRAIGPARAWLEWQEMREEVGHERELDVGAVWVRKRGTDSWAAVMAASEFYWLVSEVWGPDEEEEEA